jgi:hypothetical protein
MAIYNPKKRTEEGTEDLKFPISTIDGLQDAIDDINSRTADQIGGIYAIEGNRSLWGADKNNGIMYQEDVGLYKDAEGTKTLGSATIVNRVPIVAGNNVEFEVDTNKNVVKINVAGGETDTSDLATVDKITTIDCGISSLTTYSEDAGILANCDGSIYNGLTSAADPTFKFTLPIVEGDNIKFEVDSANQVVKINGTGGGTSGGEIVTTTGSGSAYTAKVKSITALTAGVSFIMIPHTPSTSTTATLNVNELGAKIIRRPVTTNTNAVQSPYVSNWIYANKPIRLMYNGAYWIATDFPKVMAADLSGRVPVANGGVPSATTDNAGQVLTVNDSGTPEWQTPSASGGAGGTGIEEITFIDTFYGDRRNVVANSYGVSWLEEFSFDTQEETEAVRGDIYQRIPLVAGNNITFEVDEANQVVKINASGDDGSLVGNFTFKNEIDIFSLPLAAMFDCSFTCDGVEYSGMTVSQVGAPTHNSYALYYSFGENLDAAYVVDNSGGVLGMGTGWRNESYKNINILTAPTDERLITWIKANATKKGGDTTDTMPQIRFVSMPCAGWLGEVDWEQITGESAITYRNLKFTIEIVGGGALQEGDAIQLCHMAAYGSCSGISKAKPKKRKLRRLFEHTITYEDLNKRFITFEIPYDSNPKKLKRLIKWSTNGVNDKTIYFRVRRPKGEINSGDNGGGMTVDAEFSNVVSVRLLSYTFLSSTGEYFYHIRIN